MRFSFAVALFAAASSASATLFARQSYPSCALPCISNPNVGSCSLTDTKCLCTSATFVNSTTACITKACTNPADLAQAEQFANSLCLAAGVTLSSLPATAASTGSAPASTATSPTTTASAKSTATSSAAIGAPAINGLAGFFAFALGALAL